MWIDFSGSIGAEAFYLQVTFERRLYTIATKKAIKILDCE